MGSRSPGFTEEERAFLQHRVALFWKFVFFIALVPDVLQALFTPEQMLMTGVLIDKIGTIIFGVLWLLCRRGRRSVPFILAVEWVGLGLVSLSISVTGRYFVSTFLTFVTGNARPTPGLLETTMDAYVSIMLLFGGSLLFVARSAFVPSPPLRTFVLTTVLGAPLIVVPHFFGPAPEGALPPLRQTSLAPEIGTVSLLIWWTIVGVTSAAVSQVVYGLRAEVRKARRLGQYTLEGKLGEGGMGVVYRAQHGMMRRPTAVKVLKPGMTADVNLRRFEREVQLTARLTHPNTITIFDYGRTPDGLFYYAMELLDGASLEDVVAVAGPLPSERVLHILFHVAQALAEAHDVGLIHRDIKPANIILCRQGGMDDFPKIVDFGLVKDISKAQPGLTHADAVTGTPLYLAPESLTAPESVDARSDLYSLGAVGYFALTGLPVFGGETLIEVCSHHLHTPPLTPSTRTAIPVSAGLESLILDCLQKDPAHRPSGAFELQRRLRACDGFGAWTEERARAWWKEHGDRVRDRAGEVEDARLTLTRQVDPVQGVEA